MSYYEKYVAPLKVGTLGDNRSYDLSFTHGECFAFSQLVVKPLHVTHVDKFSVFVIRCIVIKLTSHI